MHRREASGAPADRSTSERRTALCMRSGSTTSGAPQRLTDGFASHRILHSRTVRRATFTSPLQYCLERQTGERRKEELKSFCSSLLFSPLDLWVWMQWDSE